MEKFAPLTYGQVKANKDTIEALTATGLDANARTDAAVAFLKIVAPAVDFDAEIPGVLQTAALDLYKATFSRPEDATPVPQNP